VAQEDLMHESAFRFAKRNITKKTFHGVVEFGSRNVNGSIRPHVEWRRWYVGVDIKQGPDVDVVQDAAEFASDEAAELVICMETLEHASNWREIVDNAARLLATGGLFLMTCAAPGRPPHSAVDGGPLRPGEYYQNVALDDFEAVAEAVRLKTVELEWFPKLGDLYYLGEKR
jgi:SAM-dependent methyltransferase